MSPAAKSNEIWLYSQTSHNNINRMEKILQHTTLMVYILVLKDVTSWFFPGLTEKEILRQEMVAQLCMGDKTHSQLLDLISFLLWISVMSLSTQSGLFRL